MMTKKKILIGSIFAALLMVSMPFISALQNTQTQVATSTTTKSVQPSNSAAATNIQSADLAVIVADVNTICSIDPKTATPQQMINTIQLSIAVLRDMGYTTEAASFNQQLQELIDGFSPLCQLAAYTFNFIGFHLSPLVWKIQQYYTLKENWNKAWKWYEIGNKLDNFETKLSEWILNNCFDSLNGCSLCGDNTAPNNTPSPITPITTTPMQSN